MFLTYWLYVYAVRKPVLKFAVKLNVTFPFCSCNFLILYCYLLVSGPRYEHWDLTFIISYIITLDIKVSICHLCYIPHADNFLCFLTSVANVTTTSELDVLWQLQRRAIPHSWTHSATAWFAKLLCVLGTSGNLLKLVRCTTSFWRMNFAVCVTLLDCLWLCFKLTNWNG